MRMDDLTKAMARELGHSSMISHRGKVVDVLGTVVRASGLDARLGELCSLTDLSGKPLQQAEVVGFTQGLTLLSVFGTIQGISPTRTQVVGSGHILSVPVGKALLGRVIDSLGRPLDGLGPIEGAPLRPILAEPPNPMERQMIGSRLDTGVRAIDALACLAEGQRMGIFAPAGAGKSTLMGMLARGADSDVNVIALIGERGREVREFVERTLGPQGMARSVVVCATSDRSALERAKAAHSATSIAEHFRDMGMRTLLMMDSLTRFARAQREIGLACGELPARRGYPPSVFAEIPRLLERSGMGQQGSITALYTVLSEDDSHSDPIAEEVRSILDGHLILSRQIAAKNQYPAIDILGSLSRVMEHLVPAEHRAAAGRMRALLAKHAEIELLLQMGEYQAGGDPLADEAVAKIDRLRGFLCQDADDLPPAEQTVRALYELVSR